MAVQTRRRIVEFSVQDYTSSHPILTKLDDRPAHEKPANAVKYVKDKSCTLRCYMSLQGEDSPLAAAPQRRASEDAPSARTPANRTQLSDSETVCRYDWAFGIGLVENYYWDWRSELPQEGAVAVHLVLQPENMEDGPEPIPTGAVLSVLQPSRNTRSIWEQVIPASKAGAALAHTGSASVPSLELLATGLNVGSDLLASYTDKQKNWFLYQFIDQDLRCPVIEWRINRQVFFEYGPIIRGTAFLAFRRSPAVATGALRVLLRPQIRFHAKDELKYIVPTSLLEPQQQTFLDVRLT